MYTHVYMHVYIYMYMHLYMYMFICVCICMYVLMYVRTVRAYDTDCPDRAAINLLGRGLAGRSPREPLMGAKVLFAGTPLFIEFDFLL